MEESTRCKGKVWGDYHFYGCAKKATLDGYCGTHHPEKLAARHAKQAAKSKAKMAAMYAKWDRASALKEANSVLMESARGVAKCEAGGCGKCIGRLKTAVDTLDALEVKP